ncbi:MAG: N-acetylmuramoyl-L-alanine amidase, partial [Planctomycetota bacterium]
MSILRKQMTIPGHTGLFFSALALITTAIFTAAPGYAATVVVPEPTAIQVPSPNFSNRNFGTTIDSIVLHTTEGSTSSALNWLQNPASQVSAHYIISPYGTLYQMVDLDKKAWHATYYNSRSIGIEMVGFAGQQDTWNAFNLNKLIDVIAWLVHTYDIPLEHPTGDAYDYPNDTFNAPGIVNHSQVQPWNKGDPGPFFPMDSTLAAVKKRLTPILLGDYNGNGEVDAADYTLWADTFGDTVAPYAGGDGNGDGYVGVADYTVWADNFGNTAALSSGAFPVPEPSMLALLGLGGLTILGRARPSA